MKVECANPLPECNEGQEAARRFSEGVTSILSVPHSTLVRRRHAYEKKVEANPHRRGPKRKNAQRVTPYT
jgi:hypothetical protein